MPQAHANLANALQQLGRVDLALLYYASALRLKPAFTDALANMATAYLHKGAVAQVRAAHRGSSACGLAARDCPGAAGRAVLSSSAQQPPPCCAPSSLCPAGTLCAPASFLSGC